MADQGITLDFTKAQPLTPAQPPVGSAQSQPPPTQGDMQTPQRFPNATGAAEGPDGQMYWHDIQNKQLGPLNQDELALVNQPQQAMPQKAAQPKPAGVTLDFSKAQPLSGATQQQPQAPPEKSFFEHVWDTIAGDNTVLGAGIKSAKEEYQGAKDIVTGNYARGAARLANQAFGGPIMTGIAQEIPEIAKGLGKAIEIGTTIPVNDIASHIVPGSFIEKQLQKMSPGFKGAAQSFVNYENQFNPINKPIADVAQHIDKEKHPITKALLESAQNFTTPETVALLGETGGAGLINGAEKLSMANKFMSLGFSAQALASAYTHLEGFKKAYDEGNGPEALYQLTNGVVSGALTTLTARTAAGAETPLAPEVVNRGVEAVKNTAQDALESAKEFKDTRAEKKADEKITIAREHAIDNLMKAMPPTKAAPYTYEEMETGHGYLEHYDANKKVNESGQLEDAFESGRSDIEKEVRGIIRQKYGNESLTTNPKADVFNVLAEQDKVVPGFRDEAMKYLANKYNITDMNLDEADKLRAQLNTENRATLKKNNWVISDALATDPEFAARYYLADSLRDGVYGRLKLKGVENAPQMRLDEKALINLRNAAARQEFTGENKVRGTGKSSPAREVGAKIAKAGITSVAAGGGAVAGGPGGAIIGGAIGNALGDFAAKAISPPDISRNELIQQALESKGIAKRGPLHLQGEGAAPSPLSPNEPITKQQVLPENTRENSPLHSALATHYSETIGETPYKELENRFLGDVKVKKQNKVPLESSEKNLLKGINEAKAKEILDARREIEKQAKEADAKRAEAEKNPVRAELSAEDLPKLGMSALRAVADRVPDFLDNFTVEKAPIEKGYVGTVNYKGKPFAYLGVPSESFEKVFGKVSDFLGKDQTKQAEDTFNQLVRKPKEDKVIGSHIAEANQPRLEVPKERLPYGHTEDSFHNHEWGHAAVAAAEGLDATNIASHEHEAVRNRLATVGGIGFKDVPYIEDANALEKYTPKEIWENTKKWLTVDMGGAAANELLDDMKFKDNRGLATDKKNARAMLEAHGLTGKEADLMMQMALERAKNHLTKPGVLDSIRQNAKYREENLPKELHASSGRVQRFQDQIRGLINDEGKASKPAAGGAEANAPAGSGTETRPSGGKTEEKQPEAARSHLAGSAEGTLQQRAKDLANVVGAKVVGSAAKQNTSPKDIDLRVESYDEPAVQKKMKEQGFEHFGSQLVSPKEAKASGKPFGKGWQRAENFQHSDGTNVDIWHDELEQKLPEEVKTFIRQHVPEATGRLLEELPAMTPEEKLDLEAEAGRPMTDSEAYIFRINRLISDISEVKPDNQLLEQQEEFRKGLGKPQTAKQKIEGAGLVYKGELTKGSGVHMFEHPEFPGKTMALKDADITPEKLHNHAAEKLGLFDLVK